MITALHFCIDCTSIATKEFTNSNVFTCNWFQVRPVPFSVSAIDHIAGII